MSNLSMTELCVLGVLAFLGTWQTIVTWRSGTLFEKPRAWTQARQGLLSELLLCSLCLTHWIAGFWVSWVYLYLHVTRALPIWQLLLWPLCVAAVTRMVVTAHDLLYKTENFERRVDVGELIDQIPKDPGYAMGLPPTYTLECTQHLRWLRKKDGTTVLQQAWIGVATQHVEWRDIDVFEEPVGEGMGDSSKVSQNAPPLDNGRIH